MMTLKPPTFTDLENEISDPKKQVVDLQAEIQRNYRFMQEQQTVIEHLREFIEEEIKA